MMILGCIERARRASMIALASYAAAASLLGCPADTDAGKEPDAGTPDATPPMATHAGLVSIQDIAIANLPAAGHGLTVTVLFNSAIAPDYEETPGALTGCRAWSYDVVDRAPPPEEDHGALRVDGIKNGALTCRFVPQRGYVCPTANGAAETTAAASSGATAMYTFAGATFSAADVGRYLQVSGATTTANNGAFAIVGNLSPTQVVVANARASSETFAATYAVLGGAGPTPNDLYAPFTFGTKVTIALTPGGGGAFTIPETPLTPGQPFVLDDASRERIENVPLTGEPLTLSCGACGTSDGTIVRLTTTDAELTGSSPVAMPSAKRKAVEIQCAAFGTGSITVPAAAMDLVRKAHEASPVTRIRTAFMRDGLAVLANPPPMAPNRLVLAAGHGVLGFTQPRAAPTP